MEIKEILDSIRGKSHLTIETILEILHQIKAITVKSPMSIVYRYEAEERDKILNELGLDQSNRILVGALPKQS